MRILRLMTWQLLGTTVSLSVLIAGLLWMKQSFRFVSIIVVQRLSFLDFFWFVAWLLPELFSLALPFAFFIAVLLLYGRYDSDHLTSTLTNTGLADLSILRPVLYVGSLGLVFLYCMTLYIIPVSFQKFRQKELIMRSSFSEKSFQVGEFKSIGPFTIYAHSKGSGGALEGLFIYDQRKNPGESYTLASKAFMVPKGGDLGLSLQKGMRTSFEKDRVTFFDFDHYMFFANQDPKKNHPAKSYELFLVELFSKANDPSEALRFRLEAFQRLILPLYFLSFGLLAGLFMLRKKRVLWCEGWAILSVLIGQIGSLILLQMEPRIGFSGPTMAFLLALSPLLFALYQYLQSETTYHRMLTPS